VSFEEVQREVGSIRFDQFELDAKRRELRRNGLQVELPPQALKVLVILAERPGEVVTRTEIKEALWPGQSHGDFDSRLNFAIKKLREALGDDAEQPRYVQTVRNSGYRFVAPVWEPDTHTAVSLESVTRSGASEVGILPESALVAGSGLRLHHGRLVLVLAAAVLIAIAVGFSRREGKPARAPIEANAPTNVELQPEIHSVSAILPQARQRIVITGRGFGFHVPYAHTDASYLAIRDLTAHWAAGRVIPQNWDEVMVDVESWTDTEIVMSGFSGEYGAQGWKLAAGDELEVAIWNPQSGVGPALYHVTAIR
jgi:DNA-binding winged helix-turn-helix (wHTH) protein